MVLGADYRNCFVQGRCLCYSGWTGDNACKINGGTYDNRILVSLFSVHDLKGKGVARGGPGVPVIPPL